MEIDPRLQQGDKTRREWYKTLGYTWKDIARVELLDCYKDVVVFDETEGARNWVTPTNFAILQRQVEIQEWADALTDYEEAQRYGFDLNIPEDRAAWEALPPKHDAPVGDYSRDAFEFGGIAPETLA